MNSGFWFFLAVVIVVLEFEDLIRYTLVNLVK